MAVAIRGTTPATTGVTSNPISLTVTGARQPQTGDVLVIIHCNDYYALSNMPTPTVGGSTTGVTSIVDADWGALGAHVKAWYYVATGTGDLTVSATETGSADEEKGLAVYVLSGVDTATPIDVSGAASATGDVTHIAPSVSPSSSDAFLICHANGGAGSSGGGSYTPPGSMTDQYDVLVAGGMTMTGGTEQLAASGATGTRTFTAAGANTNNAEISIAIKTGGAAAVADTTSVYTSARLPGRIGPDGRIFAPSVRYDDSTAAAPTTNAPAGNPVGAGDAPQPEASVDPEPAAPTAAGSAPQPTVITGTLAAAGLASATGTALQPEADVAPEPAAPTAAGGALQPEAEIGAEPGVASATGDAPQPTVTAVDGVRPTQPVVVTSAAVQTALARRQQPTAQFVDLGPPLEAGEDVNAAAGLAAATGAASGQTAQTTGSTNAPAGLAAAAGTASPAVAAVSPNPGAPAATGTANTPLALVAPEPASPTAAGASSGTTVQTGAFTNAPAGVASATGTALQPRISAVPVAGATGSALQPTIRISVPLGVPTATGTAFAATVLKGAVAPAGLAAAIGAAGQPAATLRVLAGVAVGAGDAPAAVAQGAVERISDPLVLNAVDDGLLLTAIEAPLVLEAIEED